MNSRSYKLYDVLGVSKSASTSDIKKAYKAKALEWHPDKNIHRAELASDRFKEIASAYGVLGDTKSRARYDQIGDEVTETFSPPPEDQPKLSELAILRARINRFSQSKIQHVLFEREKDGDTLFDRLIIKIKFDELIEKLNRLYKKLNDNLDLTGVIPLSIATSEMLKQLMEAPKNIESFKKILVNYGEFFLSEQEQHPELTIFWKNVTQVLWRSLELTLHDVPLIRLDEEITKVSTIDTDEKVKRDKYVNSLRGVHKSVSKNIKSQRNNNCEASEILNSEAMDLCKSTTAALKKIKYKPESKEEDKEILLTYGEKYKKAYEQDKLFVNFIKAIGTVVVTGIEAIFGMAAGLIIGTIALPPLGGLAGIVIGALDCGADGLERGKSWTGIPKYESVGRFLFFQHATLPSAARTVSENGQEFLNSITKAPTTIKRP